MKKYPELARQVRGIPATFFLDSSGKVVGNFAGATDLSGLTEFYKQAKKKAR